MMLGAFLCISAILAHEPSPKPQEMIVFTSMSEDGKVGLFTMNADGSGRAALSRDTNNEIDPVLAPDGKHIAFVTVNLTKDDMKFDMKAELWVMDADGSNRKQVTRNPAKKIAMWPTWSPDGKHIAYTRFGEEPLAEGKADLVVMDADGKNGATIGQGTMPAWLPDGKQLMYAQAEVGGDSQPRLWMMDADGKYAKKLADIPGMMGAFSPDGKRIAFAGYPAQSPDRISRIYVANADGSKAAQVTKPDKGFQISPHWSADGQRLYFGRMPKGEGPGDKARVFVIDADGKNERELSKDGAGDFLAGAGPFVLSHVRPIKPPPGK